MRYVGELRSVGLRALAHKLVRQIWSETVYLELAVDLANVPAATAPLRYGPFTPTDASTFKGFEPELDALAGPDYLEVMTLNEYCRAGTKGLHVASSEDGRPAYTQWALRTEDRDTMPRLLSSIYPVPGPNEVLIEGAYTFAAFRRQGLMKSYMRDLLEECRRQGATRAVTLVIADKTAALRACAFCGFSPTAVRLRRRRLGYRSIRRDELTPEWHRNWVDATAPRYNA